jgi:protein disulfide-isomerase A6
MDTIRNLTNTQKVLFVLLTLLLVYCAFLIFAYLQKKNLDTKKVHFKETFDGSNTSRKSKESNKSKIILIWAEWCGHCVNFKPEFDKCREEVSGCDLKDKIEVVDFNEKDYPEKIKEYGGKGFPTVVFEDSEGKFDSYEGPRTSDGLISFINAKLKK